MQDYFCYPDSDLSQNWQQMRLESEEVRTNQGIFDPLCVMWTGNLIFEKHIFIFLLGHLLLKSRRVWGWFVPKTFLYFLFSGSLSWWIVIWVICLLNKFGEKAQCDTKKRNDFLEWGLGLAKKTCFHSFFAGMYQWMPTGIQRLVTASLSIIPTNQLHTLQCTDGNISLPFADFST